MSIWLIQQKNRTWIVVHVGQDEKCLLKSSARGREIQRDAPFLIVHSDLASFRDVLGDVQFRSEQRSDIIYQLVPVLSFLLVEPVTEIAEDFGGSPFTHTHVNGTRI